MKQLSSTSLARSTNLNRAIERVPQIQTVRKLSRLSSTMEPLEPRTLMSVATITTPPLLLAAAKTTAVTPTVVAPTVSKAPVKAPAKASTKTKSTPVKAAAPAPSTPVAVSAAGLSRTQIKLTWADSTANVSGYYVYRSSDGVHFTEAAALSGASKTTFSDTGLVGGQIYKYEVEAFNAATTSAMSSVAVGSTMLAAPSGLNVSATSSSQTHLSWVDHDSSATGYIVLRSTDGVHFTQLSKLNSTANSFVDSTANSFQKYYYEVQATNASATSPASNIASVTTPLAAPTGVSATAISPTSVKLNWTDTDPAAKGFTVLRSTNGGSFSQVEQISSAATRTWTDNTVSSNQQYSYEVKATNGGVASVASSSAAVTTPLPAPTNLIANGSSGTSVILKWSTAGSAAKGYLVLRSTDGVHFTTLATLTSGTVTTYSDTTVSGGKKYSYEIQATAGTNSSAASNVAIVTVAGAPTPSPTPAPGTSTVSITTRYTGELVITATGTADKVSVTQSGSTLTIVANGQTTTEPVPTTGLFIYARGGTDGITVDQSVTVPTTIESIDGDVDHITSGSSDVTTWDDSTDIFTGLGTVHNVSSFAGGVSKAADASLKDPTDSGTIMKVSATLWGTGPVAGDVNQGQSGDCYFLSSLAAFATVEPGMLEQSAVDMGDGTYTVEYMNNSQPEFVRVSNDLPTNGSESYVYARPGSTGSIWAAVMEKAYAFFRTGANTYASINSGWMGDVYSALGVNSGFFYLSGMSQSALYTRLSADLASNKAVTLGTFNSAPDLVSGHAYTLISCSISANGVTSYVVRNPWGISGDKLENSQGYATLTFAQMLANFQDCCEATS